MRRSARAQREEREDERHRLRGGGVRQRLRSGGATVGVPILRVRVLCTVLVIFTALPACLNAPVCMCARVCESVRLHVCACGRSHVCVCVCACECVKACARVCGCESVRSRVRVCVTCSHSRVSTRATFTATASDSACFACSAAERASADPDAPQLRSEACSVARLRSERKGGEWRRRPHPRILEDGGGEYPHVLEAGQQP